MARVPSLRASDSDREQVAERLRHATAEGRLTTDELEERLEALYATRTYGELDVLVADLPSSAAPRKAHTPAPRWAGTAAAVVLVLALLSALGRAVHSSYSAAAGTIHPEHLRFPGPLGAPYHGMVVVASMLAVLAAVAVCVALVRLLTRHTTDA